MKCSKCYGEVTFGEQTKHDCGHYTHSLNCMKEIDGEYCFKYCSACDPEQKNPPLILPIDEVKEYYGNNYIDEPGNIRYNTDMDTLFKTRPSMETIIIGNELHMQELLANGVTIDTFLKYGYTWNDLVKFKDLSEPGNRRIETLFALHCNAEHFRDYPKELPYRKMEITQKNMIDDFGLEFLKNKSLSTKHGQNTREWTIEDVDKLNLSNKDLFYAGLEEIDQYYDLKPSKKRADIMYDIFFPPEKTQQIERTYIRDNNNNNNNKVVVKRKFHGLKKR